MFKSSQYRHSQQANLIKVRHHDSAWRVASNVHEVLSHYSVMSQISKTIVVLIIG